MPLSNLIDSTAFSPETLAVIYEAFDRAWTEIVADYGDDPVRIAFVRETLARAVLTVAEPEAKDVEALKSAALATFARMKTTQG